MPTIKVTAEAHDRLTALKDVEGHTSYNDVVTALINSHAAQVHYECPQCGEVDPLIKPLSVGHCLNCKTPLRGERD